MQFFRDIYDIFVESSEETSTKIFPVSKFVEYQKELPEIFFDEIFVATEYKYLKNELEQYKFFSERIYAKKFSEYLSTIFGEVVSKFGEDNFVITSVPMYWTRYFIRGFDHMEYLAKIFSKKINFSYQKLLGTKFTRRQVWLSREKRLKNRKNIYFPKAKSNIPETVILLDDVISTASSVNECAKILKTMWVKRVIVFALATNK